MDLCGIAHDIPARDSSYKRIDYYWKMVNSINGTRRWSEKILATNDIGEVHFVNKLLLDTQST